MKKTEPESCGRTRSNGHKLENKQFRPAKKERKKKEKTTKRVVKPGNGLSREVVELPYLKMFKPCLDKVLSNLF